MAKDSMSRRKLSVEELLQPGPVEPVSKRLTTPPLSPVARAVFAHNTRQRMLSSYRECLSYRNDSITRESALSDLLLNLAISLTVGIVIGFCAWFLVGLELPFALTATLLTAAVVPASLVMGYRVAIPSWAALSPDAAFRRFQMLEARAKSFQVRSGYGRSFSPGALSEKLSLSEREFSLFVRATRAAAVLHDPASSTGLRLISMALAESSDLRRKVEALGFAVLAPGDAGYGAGSDQPVSQHVVWAMEQVETRLQEVAGLVNAMEARLQAAVSSPVFSKALDELAHAHALEVAKSELEGPSLSDFLELAASYERDWVRSRKDVESFDLSLPSFEPAPPSSRASSN